ncbi:MAG TPA: sigma-70 family RNA polymerase sigma factor [Planctomycetaceae bacterium]|nr:sigma-70 family RNA polymerase sigma factor [Planctomycetaceae bacterium]
MARCRLGDTTAFDSLVRRWQAPVARVLSRLTGDDTFASRTAGGEAGLPLRAELDDLSQEVFLRVLRACDTWEGRSAFSTWIYRIAVNVTRDAFRRRQTWRRGTRRKTPDPPAPAAIEQASRRERERLVNAALASLPAKLREPLVLRHFGDLTFAEAAEALGLPVGTVKSRVKSGLVRLREELQRRGVTEDELEE